MFLQKPHRPGTCSASSGSCGAIRARFRVREPVQHLRHRGAFALQPDREARLQHLQGLHGRDDPAAGDASPRGRPGPHQGLDPDLLLCLNRGRLDLPCRVDAQAFFPCPSPFTRGSPLANGAHTFFVKAIDAPGNESAVRSRPFTVDTVAPPTPQITATVPASPANNNSPKVKGTAQAGHREALQDSGLHRRSPAASGSGIQFASPGITAAVADNTTTSFRARAIDAAGNASACSAPRTYVEDSTAPQTTITSGPGATTNDTTPTFTFTSSESGSTFQCRFDAEAFAACSGPGASHTRSTPLSNGSHTFEVRATDRAKNIDATPNKRTFTVAP